MEKKISVVIPVFNEEESISSQYLQIKLLAAEIIWINDGSTDKTLERLKKLERQDRKVRIVSFRKNLGKSAALSAGFKIARYGIVVTMDGDLQDGPENIPEMVKKLDEGWDMVVGWRKNRSDSAAKRFSSKLWNMMVGQLSGMKLHDFNCGLKVMRREIAQELVLLDGQHRYIPVLARQLGYRVIELQIIHYPRRYGKSKYGWVRFIGSFVDLVNLLKKNSPGGEPRAVSSQLQR